MLVMSVNDAFESAYDGLYNRTSDVVPIYLVGMSAVAVIRVAPFVSAALIYLVLAYHGRTEEISGLLGDVDFDGLLDPEAADAVSEQALAEVFDVVVSTPGVVPVLVVSAVSFVLVALVVNAMVEAGRTHTVYSAILDGEPLRDGVAGAVEDYDSFVLLALLELLAVLAVSSFVLVLAGFVVLHAEGVVAALLGVVLFLVWLSAVLVLHLFFMFAPQSVVVDDVGAVEAVRGNYGFLKREPADFIAYLVVAVVGVMALGSFAGVFGAMGAQAVVPLLAYVVLLPVLDLVKTDLYARHAGEVGGETGVEGFDGDGGGSDVGLDESDVGGGERGVGAGVESPEYEGVKYLSRGGLSDASRSLVSRVDAEVRRGWREMVGFCFERWLLVAVAAVLFGGSFAGGFRVAEIYLGGFETSIESRLDHVSPFGGFLNYAANNWSVAVASSYSGLALGVPAVMALAFNGLTLGGLTATEAEPVELVAFVLPHGVVEIPALLVSGALGLHLGFVAWGFLRGGVDVDGLADEVERAYAVLVGLAVLFVVAGFVEAFVSPYYYGFLPLAA